MRPPTSDGDMADMSDTSESNAQCLANARLVLKDRVVTGRVTFEDGLITEVEEGDHVLPGARDWQTASAWG